jgi:ParB family transcriptional regulator, chromosome partitioning protein
MSTETLVIASEYRDLPVAQLQESATNPRRRFDARALEELAASFRTQGVLQPLLVRTLDENLYEVVAGARRLRAARMAELDAVPVRVREMSDAEAIEAQAIENLQREEIHPLEEALAYRNMLDLDAARYSVASIAEKVGKTPAYITQRLKLTDLIEPVAQAFLDDQIGVGHALEIAKLQPSEQEKAFSAAFNNSWVGGTQTRVLLPIKSLTTWVEQNILLELGTVPFDKSDETLVPEAGSCDNCLKRTGVNTLLFGDALGDSCTDAACYNGKMSKFVELQVTAKPQLVQISTNWNGSREGSVLPRGRYVPLQLVRKNAKAKAALSPDQKPCPHMKEAIVAEGAERGRTVRICSEPTCKIHFGQRQEPDEKAIERQKEARRKELLKRRLDATVRHRVFAEILKKVSTPLERPDLALVLQTMLEHSNPVRKETLARRHKLPPSQLTTSDKVHKELLALLRRQDESGLSKLLVEWVLIDDVESSSEEDPEAFTRAAKQYKIDVSSVRKAVEKEFTTKETKAAAKARGAAANGKPRKDKTTAAKKSTTQKKAA